MAKRRHKKEEKRQKLLDQGYVECRKCGELSRPSSFRCVECTKMLPFGKKVVAVTIAIIIVVATLGVYFLMPEEGYEVPTTIHSVSPTSVSASTSSDIIVTFNREMNRDSVESAFTVAPSVVGVFSWSSTQLVFAPSTNLEEGSTYTVTIADSAVDLEGRHLDCGIYRWSFMTEGGTAARREVGTGTDDFWEIYPLSHPQSGTTVNHPSWVLEALEQGPAMIFIHSEGCSPCVTQTGICGSVSAAYSGQISYFDLLSGTDEPEASDGFAAYDPDGGVHYIPQVIVVTKALNPADGTTIIVWHSWEGVVYEPILSSWISDAISHWDES
ncbi:MAG: Ig-like domain-containing protein [Thermoplasmata archaeon]